MTHGSIIEAAEALFAQHGIDGVSMRRISEAANARNHYAVQYHFKNKRELARAIILERMPRLETMRADLLHDVEQQGRTRDAYAMMKVLLLPYALQKNVEGRRCYAGFAVHLYWDGAIPEAVSLSSDIAPLTFQLVRELWSFLDAPVGVAARRLRMAIVSFLHTVVEVDRAISSDNPESINEMEIWEDAIHAATGYFLTPYRFGDRPTPAKVD